ncbi:mannosyl-glycoprotein endo-beta-N-acetylglucosaminidase [Streptococcus sp. DD11]|nr:mannosyl-glycoprotein endo-beta-N-acetylglucosaminidase [Streptococcus sp. DD11]
MAGSLLSASQLSANERANLDSSAVRVSEQFKAKKTGAVVFSEDVTVASSVSAEFIDSRLAGTPMAGLGKAFKKAEKDHGVNAIFLVGLAIHESDYGRSQIAQAKHNLFGFMAYDSSPFSSAGNFATFDDGIDTVARYLSEHYLKPGGQFYNGKSMAAINVKYASDKTWHSKIAIRIRNFLKTKG